MRNEEQIRQAEIRDLLQRKGPALFLDICPHVSGSRRQIINSLNNLRTAGEVKVHNDYTWSLVTPTPMPDLDALCETDRIEEL